MKVRWHSMEGTNHSWAFVAQALARAMIRIGGNEIYIKSTNNLEHFPDDLKPYLIPGYHGPISIGNADYVTEDRKIITINQKNPLPEIPDKNYPYDMDLAYTIFYQGPRRFYPTSKIKALIWNFESSILPPG